jgi:N-acetylneuraminic acid mutarotase
MRPSPRSRAPRTWSEATTEPRPLARIVAWRPGGPARVVGALPSGLRYAAVAASEGRLLIAGGSRGEAASSTILRFDPAGGGVRAIGRMPVPVTHATAVALGRYVYVLGGRGAAADSQSAAIVAVDPASGRAVPVGRLPHPISDAAAVVADGRVWVFGGRTASGTVSSILELEPLARRR